MSALALRAVAVFASLLTLWLLLSGIYKPHLIAFGVMSAGLCTFLIVRLGLLAGESAGFRPLALMRYLGGLIVDIGRADWKVTRVILGPQSAIRQSFIRIPATPKTDLGRMLFANSITITPGTVCFETEDNELLIHGLTEEATDKTELDKLGSRVCATEKA